MAKDLVIVESPAKARTVGRFLGKQFEAVASMGHVRDLPKKNLEISENEDFKPKYLVIADKRKIVSELKKASSNAETVYLATDPDREGEAIAWHLIEAAKIDVLKVKRVVFHEITESAVKEAFDNTRDIDTNLVDAQQARRVIDHVVGFDLSPVLWKKVRSRLSAGRVQSVALRFTVDREEEIKAFQAEEYWSVDAVFSKKDSVDDLKFESKLRSIKGKSGNLKITDGQEAKNITSDLDSAKYSISKIDVKERKTKPAPPFITSSLQQEAFRKLRFTTRQTMSVAQQLYQGVNVGSDGPLGLITYMRTDSTNVATSAVSEVRTYIKDNFGSSYLPKSPRAYKKKVRGAQEAHEAIRPTSIYREPKSLEKYLTPEQFRLYDLIWRRMLSSQMADAIFDSTSVDVDATETKSGSVYLFRSTGSVIRFPGFRRLYMEDKDDPSGDKEDVDLPVLLSGDSLNANSIMPKQHFTQPPPRFTEASLVRALEERGIGRPSTYASIIATVVEREYVTKEKGRLVPTKLGIVVSNFLIQHFPDIMDVGFTARIEEELDEIAKGEREWSPVFKEFYTPFNKSVIEARENAERVPRDQIDEESDEFCESCERPMVIKSGKFGKFLACTGFPECRNTKPFTKNTGINCPEDSGELLERQGRGGKGRGPRTFYGCSNYPDCTFTSSQRPLPVGCPECGKLLVASGRTNARCVACEYKGPVPESEDAVELAS